MTDSRLPPDIYLADACKAFSGATATESAEHIKPLHRHLAMRLVIEGGFLPADLRPQPPLSAELRGKHWYLSFDAAGGSEKEQVILGALKSKRVDLAVVKEGIGPIFAISVKGTSKAFRNLVNRTEEAIGDCANIHIMYPGLVYGFVHFLKATDFRDSTLEPNDLSLDENNKPMPAIKAYAKILEGLSGRRLVRNDYARYESVGLALVGDGIPGQQGPLLATFPPPDSPLALGAFFATLYDAYDQRYPYMYTDPAVKQLGRVEWHPESPVLASIRKKRTREQALGYAARMALPGSRFK